MGAAPALPRQFLGRRSWSSTELQGPGRGTDAVGGHLTLLIVLQGHPWASWMKHSQGTEIQRALQVTWSCYLHFYHMNQTLSDSPKVRHREVVEKLGLKSHLDHPLPKKLRELLPCSTSLELLKESGRRQGESTEKRRKKVEFPLLVRVLALCFGCDHSWRESGAGRCSRSHCSRSQRGNV